jgi:hypothetical protein
MLLVRSGGRETTEPTRRAGKNVIGLMTWTLGGVDRRNVWVRRPWRVLWSAGLGVDVQSPLQTTAKAVKRATVEARVKIPSQKEGKVAQKVREKVFGMYYGAKPNRVMAIKGVRQPAIFRPIITFYFSRCTHLYSIASLYKEIPK